MSSTTQSVTEEILKDLVRDTESARVNLESRSRRNAESITQIAAIRDDIDNAIDMKDDRRRAARLKILESNLEELRTDAVKEERDLAKAVFGLNAEIEGMGQEYENLNALGTGEQGLIDSAKQELEDANAQLAQAQSAWFFRGTKIRKAQARIIVATQGIKDAEVEAKSRQRDRLMSANMEASLQEIQVRATKTVQIMKRRRVDIIKQIEAVSSTKERLFDDLKKAATAIEKFDVLILQREADLRQAEELLATLDNGSDEHAGQSKLVSQLKAQVDELVGGRNTAVTKHQSADKFSKELQVHEQAQVRLRDNLQMWITALEADTESRVVTFRSRLEAMKASADQDVARNIDDLGAEADQRNVEAMAQMGAASDRARVDRFDKIPGRIRGVVEVAQAQIQARQQIEAKMHVLLEEFRAQYNIDPMATSFFAEGNQPTGGDSPESTN